MNEDLRAFVHVAQTGSFNRASGLLYVTPTAVMKRMDRLEAEVGVRLLVRTRRGVALTEAGESFLRDARLMLELEDKAVWRARRASGGAGVVRVGSSLLNPAAPLLDLWAKVALDHPKVGVEVVQYGDATADLMAAHRALGSGLDVIVGPYDPRSLRWGHETLDLGWTPFCVGVPIGHPLAAKGLLGYDDLAGETITLVEPGASLTIDSVREALLRECAGLRVVDEPRHVSLETFNRVAAGDGLMLTMGAWEGVSPLVRTVPMEWGFGLPVGAMCAPGATGAVREVLGAVGDLMASQG